MMTAKSNLNSVEHNTRIYNLLLLYRRFASFMYKKDWYVAVGSWWIDGFFVFRAAFEATPFLLLWLIKRKVWPLPCSHSLSQPWLCSRSDLPYRLFVERSYSRLRFPRWPLRALRVAVLSRSSFAPIVPMMQSTLPNHSAQVSLSASLRYLAEVSHHFLSWERPLSPASGFHIGFALQWSWCLRLRVW